MEQGSTTDSVEKELMGTAQSQSEGASADEGAQTESAPKNEEEEEECGFCLFMKGGPCGQRFTLWQDCVDGAEKSEKDIVQQCAQMTTLLKVCMEMNPQYYGPVLDAEKAMEAEVGSLEENAPDEGKSGEASAGGGDEGVENANGGQVVETIEVLEIVVDDEGQVGDDGTLREASGGGGEEGLESAHGEQVIGAVDLKHVGVDDKGQVVKVADAVEVEVRAL